MTAFAEQPIFTRAWAHLGFDVDGLFALQDAVAADPTAAPNVPGAGRLRKLRWKRPGGGKRGGVRVLFGHFPARGVVLLLFVYPKSVTENVSPATARGFARALEEYGNELDRRA